MRKVERVLIFSNGVIEVRDSNGKVIRELSGAKSIRLPQVEARLSQQGTRLEDVEEYYAFRRGKMKVW